MANVKYEFIKEIITTDDIDVNRSRTGMYISVIREWKKTDNKTLKFTCKGQREKNTCRSSISSYLRKNKLDYTVYCEKNKFNVYIVRA